MPPSTVSKAAKSKAGSTAGSRAVSTSKAGPTSKAAPESARSQGSMLMIAGLAVVVLVAVAGLVFTFSKSDDTGKEYDFGPAGMLKADAVSSGKQKRSLSTDSSSWKWADCWDYKKYGANYDGRIKKSKSGLFCEPWSEKLPKAFMKYFWNASMYYMTGCANPSWTHDIHEIWCFVTAKKKEWEECDITKCELTPCFSEPCQHQGKCSNIEKNYRCTCTGGYYGLSCDENRDKCASTPCYWGGICTNDNGGYKCKCTSKYEGPRCANKKMPCGSTPCYWGGKCTNVDGGKSYTCSCRSKYKGKRCATKKTFCDSGPCFWGGKCTNFHNLRGFTGYKCKCRWRYSGDRCQFAQKAVPYKPHGLSGVGMGGGFAGRRR